MSVLWQEGSPILIGKPLRIEWACLCWLYESFRKYWFTQTIYIFVEEFPLQTIHFELPPFRNPLYLIVGNACEIYTWTSTFFQRISSGLSSMGTSGSTLSDTMANLVGSWTYPSEKYEFVNWDNDIPNMWKNSWFMFQSPPTRLTIINHQLMIL